MSVTRWMAWLCLSLIGCDAGDDVPRPMIASIIPDRATPGASVMIVGDYFCAQPEPDSEDVDPFACRNMGTVQFGPVPTTYGTYTDTSVLATVPDLPAGTTVVTITVVGRRSNSVEFVVE